MPFSLHYLAVQLMVICMVHTITGVIDNVYAEWGLRQGSVHQPSSRFHIHIEPLFPLVYCIIVYPHSAPGKPLIGRECYGGVVLQMFKVNIAPGTISVCVTGDIDFVFHVPFANKGQHYLSLLLPHVDLMTAPIINWMCCCSISVNAHKGICG